MIIILPPISQSGRPVKMPDPFDPGIDAARTVPAYQVGSD
jgi:hypothetical protein